MRSANRFSWVVALPAIIFLMAFAVLPVLVLLRTSLGLGRTGLGEVPGFTFNYYLEIFASPALRTSAWNSLLVSVLAVVITIAVSIPVVLELAKRSRANYDTTAVDTVLTVPIALPGTVIGFFAIVLLGNTGLLGQVFPALRGVSYTIPGVLIAYIYFSLPRIIGPLRGAAQALDPGLAEAARSLGAGRWQVFRTITWPLLLPAVIESAGTALATALGGYGTIATLSQGVRLLPLDVVDKLSSAGYQVASASATAVILGLMSVAFLIAGQMGSRALLRSRTDKGAANAAVPATFPSGVVMAPLFNEVS